jgi:hypothetical protein
VGPLERVGRRVEATRDLFACAEQRQRSAFAYPAFLRTDRNLIPSLMAFCETAPGVRPSFFAACGCDSLTFANARKFLTSSFDHANKRRFRFAIDAPLHKSAYHTRANEKTGTLYSRTAQRSATPVSCHPLS